MSTTVAPGSIYRTIRPLRGVTLRLRAWTPQDLRWALRTLQLTQVGLAKMLSVDPRSVRRWVLGKGRIPGPVVVLIEMWLRMKGYA